MRVECRRYDRVVSLGFLVSPTGTLTPTLRSRVDRAIDHYRQGSTRTLVMSGGRLDSEPCSAASAMKAYAASNGISANDILEQGDALDTVGEAIFLRLLVPPLRAGGRLLIVTSDFHAARAERIFRFVYGTDLDLSVEAAPNGPDHETPSAAKESASLERFDKLFLGIDAGDIEAILSRFWQRHALYRDSRHDDLRQRTFSALAAIKRS
jgi:uncharacterized SAM-binding protein YcdF (DUF218 family)